MGAVLAALVTKNPALFNECEEDKRKGGVTGLNMNREKEKGTLCKIESCRNVYIEYEKALNTVGDCDITPGQSYIDIVTKNLPGGKFCGTADSNTAAIPGSNAKNGRDQINESNKQAPTLIFMVLGIVVLGHFVLL